MIFLNIKHWFIVIRYLMTWSWRHNACIFYLLCSKDMPSFKFVWSLQVCVFCRQSIGRRGRRKKKKKKKRTKTIGFGCIPEHLRRTRLKFLSEQKLGVRVNFRFNQVSSWWRHNHIFENAWRFYHNNNYQFHLQNTYTFCVSKGHIRSFESHIWNNTSSWSSKITLVLTLVQEIQVFIMYN